MGTSPIKHRSDMNKNDQRERVFFIEDEDDGRLYLIPSSSVSYIKAFKFNANAVGGPHYKSDAHDKYIIELVLTDGTTVCYKKFDTYNECKAEMTMSKF